MPTSKTKTKTRSRPKSRGSTAKVVGTTIDAYCSGEKMKKCRIKVDRIQKIDNKRGQIKTMAFGKCTNNINGKVCGSQCCVILH